MLDDIGEILLKHWNYKSFRPLQENIIKSVLEGNDTLAILPTGGGKSLCYQLPAIILKKKNNYNFTINCINR